ncbi:MAG: Gfo/Idh/MocA family oxidoreductase [Pseudolysinimonas sp.]|uniref:Gfo/Idh/MocA family protein n=1 Tax=Pseudolysinimonas sp. TaxID=2680009 RepID=UPI0032632B72
MTERHRVVVVGAGRISSMHFDYFAMRPERIELVGAVDPSDERRAWAADTYGIPTVASIAEAIADIDFDIAVVATPSHVRVPAVRELAAAGKHILVEKPFANSIDEAQQMVAAADEGGVQLAVDQNFRDHYPFELARAAIAAGRIGRVIGIEQRELQFRSEVGWRMELDRYALMIMGVHWFDGFRMLADSDPTWLTASIASSPAIETNGETDAFALVRFGDIVATLVQSFSSRVDSTETVVLGEAGTLHLDYNRLEIRTADGVDVQVGEGFGDGKSLSAYRQLEHLLDAIDTGGEAPNSGRDNLRTIGLLEAVYDSAAHGGAPVTFSNGMPIGVGA